MLVFVAWWPSTGQARTQLAWHKKLPFDGEHLKLMGQASVFFPDPVPK